MLNIEPFAIGAKKNNLSFLNDLTVDECRQILTNKLKTAGHNEGLLTELINTLDDEKISEIAKMIKAKEIIGSDDLSAGLLSSISMRENYSYKTSSYFM